MSPPVAFERREIQVASTEAQSALHALWGLGVSVRYLGDESMTALIRLGAHGRDDRVSIYQVELRHSNHRQELIQWLTMCWDLPCVPFMSNLARSSHPLL